MDYWYEENEFNGKIAAGRNNTTENTRIGSKALYKEKAKQAAAEASHVRYETGTEQASEFADSDKRGKILRDSNLAGNSSVGPVEDVSEDFSKMNRSQDVITEK